MASTVVAFETIDVAVGRDDVLYATDVVADTRLHFSRARVGEEREGEPLEVSIDARAQVVHDALADLIREQGLEHADDAGQHGDGDHAADERREQTVVAIRKGVVKNRPQKKGRDHADGRRHEDEPKYRAEAPTVQAKQAPDPTDVRLANRPVIRAAGVFVGLEHGSSTHSGNIQ